MMDFWAQRCLEESAEAASQSLPPPAHSTEQAMVCYDNSMPGLRASCASPATTGSTVQGPCCSAI